MSKSFLGLQALKKVDMHINKGEVVDLTDLNGSEETTLFNMIMEYLKPSEGEILFDDEAITGSKPNILAKKGIARTFQIVKPLSNLTVLKNVMVAAFLKCASTKEMRKKAGEIFNKVGFYHVREQIASKLTLAGRKRLELARALAIEPKIVLLYEVMTGLNATEVKITIDLIRKIRESGINSFIIEHIMHVIILHYGEKLCEGTPKEIIKDQRVLESYLGEGFNFA